MKGLVLLQILSFVLGCAPSKPLQEEHQVVVASPLVRGVVNTLADSHRLGSLAYEGQCSTVGTITDSFRVGAIPLGVSPVQAFQNAFANEPRLTAKEDVSGRIRVVGGNVHTDLLELRFPQITFESEDNPRGATTYLLTRPEVKAYMQSHHISFESTMGGIAPMPKGAHLNATLRNVTLYEALDRVAETFPGVWIYSECSNPSGERIVDIRFIEF